MLQRLTITLALFAAGCVTPPSPKMAWVHVPIGSIGGVEPSPIVAQEAPKEISSGLQSTPAITQSETQWQLPQVALPSAVVESLLLDWPLAATGITSLYGPRPDPVEKRLGFHYGVDMSAAYGTEVMSSASGIVITSGWNGGHGRRVVIQHRYGYRTSYSHLSQVIASPGHRIGAGQPIGLVGNSGRSTGPHLHFEVTRYGKHLDPLEILGMDLSKD